MRGHRTRTEFTAHLRKCAKPKSKGYFLTDADKARILKAIEDSPALDGIESLDLRTSETLELSGGEKLRRAFESIFYTDKREPINIGHFTSEQAFDKYTKGIAFKNGNYCFINGSLYIFDDGEWNFYSKAI